ncbi:bacterioferritin, partial [Pseudomonas syringae pv. tagetis]
MFSAPQSQLWDVITLRLRARQNVED